MRRLALLLSAVVTGAAASACDAASRAEERAARIDQRFTSDEAVLVDFQIDGVIRADTYDVATLRTLIGAQLLYSVGQLNADRSVGRHERLELTNITRAPNGDVTYHARLPVAWGRPAEVPSSYELVLPARAGESDQTAFAAKYGESCVAPEAGGGPIHPARMFLFYRPRSAGCTLGTDDVVKMTAKVTPSTENTTGKYPEYDRVWEDGALRVVATFSRAEAEEKTGTNDEGVYAFYEFMTGAVAHAKALGASSITTGGGTSGWSLSGTLPDGRELVVDARLVGHELARESAAFDAWYDARTPEADLIVYSGHAGLGWNVRTLMAKGKFRAGKYVIWAANGCDTFAYVDRTLAERRAALNPDDPGGTKYMDVVSNVMAGYFHTGAETTLTLIDALAGEPKTYREIFASIDPEQVVAVTGEEDNVFSPKVQARSPDGGDIAKAPAASLAAEPNEESATAAERPERRTFARACSAATSPADGGDLITSSLLAAAAIGLGARRRRRSWRGIC